MKNYTRFFIAAILLIAANSIGYSSTRFLSSYPLPNAKYVSPSTTIGITYSVAVDGITPEKITVRGSNSGIHTGTIKFSADHRTLLFIPSHPFSAVETVLISVVSTPSVSFTFTTGETSDATNLSKFHSDDPITEKMLHPPVISVKSHQPESLPVIDILKNNSPAEGDLFLTNLTFGGPEKNTNYMILDNSGNVSFSRPAGQNYAMDFRPWPNRTYTYFDAYMFAQKYYVLDSNLLLIDSLKAANGYQTDGHELIFTKDGGYLMLALQNVKMDMRQFNELGNSNATVLNCIIQEFDKEKNLIFEWRSLDHFIVTDAIFLDFSANVIDYCHANAIEIDEDGNLLLSSRHMDEITKIDRKTGQIIWRLGGLNNQFTFPNDTIQFSHQHDIRRTAAGTYTLFDNGNLHTKGGIFSRALEYRIDENEMTATKVWEFRHSPDLVGEAMGGIQRLPNGNSLICWGACDEVAITEVDKNNTTTFEMAMKDANYSYRAYKFTKADLMAGVSLSIGTNNLRVNCFPNPISATGKLSVSTANDEMVRLALYDYLGREVYQIYNGKLSNGNEVPIDITSLTNGIYQLQATTENGGRCNTQIVVLK